MGDVLVVSNVYKGFVNGSVRTEVLKGVSFRIRQGEFVSIVGPSGSGKSTLLGLIAGLDTVDQGQIVMGDKEITRMPERELARLRGAFIGYVFQSFNLISTLTALENVQLPMLLNGKSRGAYERAKGLLDLVGLSHRLGNLPSQMSGGEQQRVAIARALACDPPIIVADEPTGNLDSANSLQIMTILTNLARQNGKTLIVVTHDRQFSSQADRVLTMRDGAILEEDAA